MRHLIAFVVLLLLALIASAQTLEEGQKHKLQESKASRSNTNYDKQFAYPPVTITVSPTISATNHPSEEKQYEQKESTWEALTGISTAILAAITAALAYFTYWLWSSTSKLVKEAADTARRQLRAYVALEDIFFEKGGLMIRIKNHGPTPAHRMTIWTWATDTEPTERFDYPYPGGEPVVGEQMLHPSQHYTARCSTGLSYTFATSGFFPYGRIVYQDIYDRWWITSFCYLYEGENRFMPHGNYNREDGPYKHRPY